MILFKYPKLLALLLGAIIVFFVAQIPHFELDASSDSLVLENDEDLLYYRKIQKQHQTNNIIVIAYTSKSDDLMRLYYRQRSRSRERHCNWMDRYSGVFYAATNQIPYYTWSGSESRLIELVTRACRINKASQGQTRGFSSHHLIIYYCSQQWDCTISSLRDCNMRRAAIALFLCLALHSALANTEKWKLSKSIQIIN